MEGAFATEKALTQRLNNRLHTIYTVVKEVRVLSTINWRAKKDEYVLFKSSGKKDDAPAQSKIVSFKEHEHQQILNKRLNS